MRSIVDFPGKRGMARRVGLSGALAAALLLSAALAAAPVSLAQDSQRAEQDFERASSREELGRLFDAVVDAVKKSFWDKGRLAELNWPERMRGERAGVVASPDLQDAARRINLLLDELNTSHTVLLTPDDVDYYVLRGVFGRGRAYAGIGVFTARIDGRDFIDLLLEGYPADRAGLKVGDEIVSVDGAPYHPIRSFRGKGGRDAAVAVRRSAGGPIKSVDVDVVSIEPLKAFSDATLASTRIIEQDGRRIGYVHVWASVGDVPQMVAQSLERLGLPRSPDHKKAPTVPTVDGLIFDMRGKIGGVVGVATRYLELLDPRGPDIAWRGTSRESPTSVRGRTAVLIDHHTRSTGEVFVHSYKRERQGPLIGTTTAGAVSGGAALNMPADCLLHVAVAGLMVDGEVIEGRGVAPDITIQRPLPYSGGADPVLDAALAELVKRPPRQAPARSDPKGTSQ
jgi:carboxyl-terminal processing protease